MYHTYLLYIKNIKHNDRQSNLEYDNFITAASSGGFVGGGLQYTVDKGISVPSSPIGVSTSSADTMFSPLLITQ